MKQDTAAKQRASFAVLSRLYKVHSLIINNDFPSTGRIASALEVTERTVRRDVAFLRDEVLAPISFDRKRGGYHYTHLNWDFPMLPVSDSELHAFFFAILLIQSKSEVYQTQELKKALAKIAKRLPDEVYQPLSFMLENISISETPTVLVDSSVMTTLTRAMTERETVEFRYVSPQKGESERRVNILQIHNNNGDWYAIGLDLDKQAKRDFHIGRIFDIRRTGEFFTPPRDFDREEYLSGGFGMFRGGKKTKVSILFDPEQAKYIRERSKFHPKEQREDLPDGSLRLKFTIGEKGLEAVARFCLQWCGSFIAEEPERLRKIIRVQIEKALEDHK